jgi:drug/metabolite transporter (DMT)-like permease
LNAVALLLALLTAFFWAASQVIGKLAMKYMTPLTFNTLRFAFALFAALPPVLMMFGIRPYSPWLLFLAFLTAALGWFLGNQLYYAAMKIAPAHLVIPAGNSYPFWAMILAAVFLGESVGIGYPLSALLILTGGTLLLGAGLTGSGWRRGIAMSLLVASIWGVKAVLNKYSVGAGMIPSDLLIYTLLFAFLLFSFSLVARGGPKRGEINRRSVALVLASGVLGFPLGELLYLTAIGMESVSAVTPLISTTILFGFLLSMLLAREKPTWRAAAGTLLIFAGVVVAAIS